MTERALDYASSFGDAKEILLRWIDILKCIPLMQIAWFSPVISRKDILGCSDVLDNRSEIVVFAGIYD